MTDSIREFGTLVAGADNVLRPGGYVVIIRPPGQIAVVKTPLGCYLPGGGQEHEETPARAAVRETCEECGLPIRILAEINAADELVYGSEEATYFRERCTFFLAEISGPACGGCEPDHVLCWVGPDEAAAQLCHESERWAVAEACRIMTGSGGLGPRLKSS